MRLPVRQPPLQFKGEMRGETLSGDCSSVSGVLVCWSLDLSSIPHRSLSFLDLYMLTSSLIRSTKNLNTYYTCSSNFWPYQSILKCLAYVGMCSCIHYELYLCSIYPTTSCAYILNTSPDAKQGIWISAVSFQPYRMNIQWFVWSGRLSTPTTATY